MSMPGISTPDEPVTQQAGAPNADLAATGVTREVDGHSITLTIASSYRRSARWPMLGTQSLIQTASGTIGAVLAGLLYYDPAYTNWTDQAVMLIVGIPLSFLVTWAIGRSYARRRVNAILHANFTSVSFAERKPAARSRPDFRPVVATNDITYLHVCPFSTAADLNSLVVEKRDNRCITIPLVAEHEAASSVAYEVAAHVNALRATAQVNFTDGGRGVNTSGNDLKARSLLREDGPSRQFAIQPVVPHALGLGTMLLAAGLVATIGSHAQWHPLQTTGAVLLGAACVASLLWWFCRSIRTTVSHHTVEVLDRWLIGYRRAIWRRGEIEDVHVALLPNQKRATLCWTAAGMTRHIGATRHVGDLVRVCSALREELGLP